MSLNDFKGLKHMDIIIGSLPPITHTFPEQVPQKSSSEMVEAKLLHVRRPRRGISGPSGMERRGSVKRDPLKGRVLTVMVPDVGTLPRDIDTSDYQVLIRFTRK